RGSSFHAASGPAREAPAFSAMPSGRAHSTRRTARKNRTRRASGCRRRERLDGRFKNPHFSSRMISQYRPPPFGQGFELGLGQPSEALEHSDHGRAHGPVVSVLALDRESEP